MTVESEISRINFLGNGATTTFAYTFKVFSEDDLLVTQRDTDDVETTLVLNTDYTVTGVGETSGGNVVLTNPLTTDYVLSVRRVMEIKQETSITNQTSFYPLTHENAYDKIVMIEQQLQDGLLRAPKLPETIDPDDFDNNLPASLLGAVSKALITNTTGDGWAEGPSAADIANANTIAAAAAASAAAAAASAAQAASYAGANQPDGVNNIGFSASVGSSNLTVTLTQADGSTAPSTGVDAVSIYFRSTIATSGSYSQQTVTSSISLVVPSGATLGHNDGIADYIYLYALNNAGSVELAVSSSCHWNTNVVQSTTAIGTGSDDAATLYSTSARTNVAIRLIGRMLSSQTTAGTYASAPSVLEVGTLFPVKDIDFARSSDFIAKHGARYAVSTAAARAIQLPTPRAGLFFDIKDSTNQADSNNITLTRHGSESIDASAADKTLSTQGGSWRIYSDGTNWFSLFSGAGSTSFNRAVFDGPTTPTDFGSSGAYSTLALSTGSGSSNPYVTVSTNVLTLAVGTYRVKVRTAHLYAGSPISPNVEIILYNTTAASTKVEFMGFYFGAATAEIFGPIVDEALITINSTEAAQDFELQGKYTGSAVAVSTNGNYPVWRLEFEKVG